MWATGICLVIALTSFISHPRKLEPVAFMQWVLSPSSGLQGRVTQGSYDYIASYLPTEFVALQQLKGQQVDRKKFSAKYQELKGTEHYTFLINLNNGKKNAVKSLSTDSEIPVDQLVHFMAYDLQHEIRLVNGSDTLQCKFLHFEETFEITSYARFMVMFEHDGGSRSSGDRHLLVSLPWLNEQLVFTIGKENLQRIPKVIVK